METSWLPGLPRQPSLWDAFVCWEVTHRSQFKSYALQFMSGNAWRRGWIRSRLCVCDWEGGFVPGRISAHLLFKNARVPARVPARVLLQLALSVFVYAEPKEEPSGVPVSGYVWSGSRLLVPQDPNSALRDSYSKPTHSSIKPWTTSPFLD